jgi:putative ABC transport system ATP-binding protein
MARVIAHDLFHDAGGVELLRGVSLEAHGGALTAVVGPAGAGKTSLLHLLAGLDRPRAGGVALDGVRLASLDQSALTALRRDRIGLLLPGASMLPTITVAENVALPQLIAGRPPRREDVDALLDRVGLAGRGDELTQRLTACERQRAALARALAGRPSVLLVDEPRDDALPLLRDIAHEDEIAVLVFMRNADAVAEFADEVVALEGGRPVTAAAPLAA